MLQEDVDAYIAVLAVKEDKQFGTNTNTVLAYRNDIKQLSSYLQAEEIEHWSQVTPDHLATFFKDMREEHAYRPATIARKLAAFKSFFRFLVKQSHIETNPAETLEAPPITREMPPVLTIEQVSSLFKYINVNTVAGQRDLAMLHVLYATGMRASEIVSLRVTDFDQQQALITSHGSSITDHRELPLPPFVVRTVVQYLTNARSRLLRHAEEQGLFLNHHGERLTRQGFWLIIKGYARQAGISEITPHMLRHSFAMLLIRNDIELQSMEELLGQAQATTVQAHKLKITATSHA